MDLDGKVALVTGASRGVGAATAIALAEAGCLVACAARSTKDKPQRTAGTLDETLVQVKEAGSTGLAVPTDLADRGAVRSMVAQTVDRFGRIDILVNNAAVQFIGDLRQPERRHDLTFRGQLLGPVHRHPRVLSTHGTRGGGAIINVSSLAALVPIPNMLSYGTSKIALEHLTLDAARELFPKRIAVNCFRIDLAVASEGLVANTPGAERSGWEPCEVPAEGIVWMLRQPLEYTGRRESMYHLRKREGIMSTRAAGSTRREPPPTELFVGLYGSKHVALAEPYD